MGGASCADGEIAQVEGAAECLRVVRVESESANVIAKINAELLGAASAG